MNISFEIVTSLFSYLFMEDYLIHYFMIIDALIRLLEIMSTIGSLDVRNED